MGIEKNGTVFGSAERRLVGKIVTNRQTPCLRGLGAPKLEPSGFSDRPSYGSHTVPHSGVTDLSPPASKFIANILYISIMEEALLYKQDTAIDISSHFPSILCEKDVDADKGLPCSFYSSAACPMCSRWV
jgi:hypothetical protein